MRPGLTGLWRLRTGDIPIEDRVALDIYYIRNYTLTLDLQILLNTFKQLVLRLGGQQGGLARWVRDIALAGDATASPPARRAPPMNADAAPDAAGPPSARQPAPGAPSRR